MEIMESDNEKICNICERVLGKYVCPKCNIFYCSLKCYQSAKHLQCSEKFYENCLKEDLKARNTDQRILDDISDIIKRVNDQFPSDIDSDDEDDLPDLAERLEGVDLNDSDTIWNKLTKDEQQEFEACVSSGNIAECLPIFKPWWEHTVEQKIQEIDISEEATAICPKIVEYIKPFQLLTRVTPAPCVKFNLINVLAGYTFIVRYFNGDHFDYAKEAVYVLTTLSKNLLLNFNFDNYAIAVESVHQASLQNDWVFSSPDTIETIRSDVKMLLKHSHSNSKSYILCALSDIYNLLHSCKQNTHKNGKFSKRFLESIIPPDKVVSKSSVMKCIFKIEYYLSYMQTFTCAPAI